MSDAPCEPTGKSEPSTGRPSPMSSEPVVLKPKMPASETLLPAGSSSRVMSRAMPTDMLNVNSLATRTAERSGNCIDVMSSVASARKKMLGRATEPRNAPIPGRDRDTLRLGSECARSQAQACCIRVLYGACLAAKPGGAFPSGCVWRGVCGCVLYMEVGGMEVCCMPGCKAGGSIPVRFIT